MTSSLPPPPLIYSAETAGRHLANCLLLCAVEGVCYRAKTTWKPCSGLPLPIARTPCRGGLTAGDANVASRGYNEPHCLVGRLLSPGCMPSKAKWEVWVFMPVHQIVFHCRSHTT